jgi:hypothetical protein
LSGFRCSLYQLDENVIQGREYLVEGADVETLVDEELHHIVVAEPDLFVFHLLHIKKMDGGMLCQNVLVEAHFKNIFLEFLLDVANRTIEDLVPFVDKHNMITDLFYLFHAMRTEDDRSTFFGQSEDLILDQIGVHRVQSAERFIQYDQLGFVYYSGHEL